MSETPTISVVVPIHNEADYLRRGVSGLAAELAPLTAEVEVTLVENGSTDDTAAVAEALGWDKSAFCVASMPAQE